MSQIVKISNINTPQLSLYFFNKTLQTQFHSLFFYIKAPCSNLASSNTTTTTTTVNTNNSHQLAPSGLFSSSEFLINISIEQHMDSVQAWISEHKLTSIGAFWASAVGASLAYTRARAPHKTSVRLIHARMHAQALTLAMLSGAAIAHHYYDQKQLQATADIGGDSGETTATTTTTTHIIHN